MEKWVLLKEAYNDVEAEIILGLLESAGIPAESEESDPYTGSMRVIGGMAYEINIMVPEKYLKQAQKLLEQAEESLREEGEEGEDA